MTPGGFLPRRPTSEVPAPFLGLSEEAAFWGGAPELGRPTCYLPRPPSCPGPNSLGHVRDAAIVGVYPEGRAIVLRQFVGQLDRSLVELFEPVSSFAAALDDPASQFVVAGRQTAQGCDSSRDRAAVHTEDVSILDHSGRDQTTRTGMFEVLPHRPEVECRESLVERLVIRDGPASAEEVEVDQGGLVAPVDELVEDLPRDRRLTNAGRAREDQKRHWLLMWGHGRRA
jgi:hypothetical protein